MMNSTIWELGNDDNNCNKSWGWTCHWGILGIDQLGSEYQILTLFDLNLSSQAVNGCCICSAPFVCPVCQLSGAFCRAADCGNLFQMLPFLSVYISAKSRVERLSSKPELNNTAAIQCQVLEIWGWEKLSFCLLWWFVCKCRGQVAASRLWFARSQRSVAPESCDVSRTGKEIFCQLLKLAICCNQMCRNWENRNKETLCTASKAELAHTLKSGSMAHIVCWLSPSLRAWSTWAHGHVKGVLTLEGKTHVLWVQRACWAAELSEMGSECPESWQGYVWIKKVTFQWVIQNQAWYLEPCGYCRLLRALPWAWPVCTQPRRARFVDAEQAPYHPFVLYQALVVLSMRDLQWPHFYWKLFLAGFWLSSKAWFCAAAMLFG